MLSQEGMTLRLLENGFEREDEEYLSNRNYGYLVKVEEDDYVEVFSTETSGSLRIPFEKIEFEEGTIRFPFNAASYKVGNPYNFEAIGPKSTPRIIREDLAKGLINMGYERKENYYVRGNLKVEINQFRLKVTDGSVELFPSIRAVMVREPSLAIVVANTLVIAM